MSYLLGISRLIQLILKLHKASGLKSAFLFYLIAQILVPPKDFSPIGSLEALYIYVYFSSVCGFFFILYMVSSFSLMYQVLHGLPWTP